MQQSTNQVSKIIPINYTIYADKQGCLTLDTADGYVYRYYDAGQLGAAIQKLQNGGSHANWVNLADELKNNPTWIGNHVSRYVTRLDQDDINDLIGQYKAQLSRDEEIYLRDSDGYGLGEVIENLIKLLATN